MHETLSRDAGDVVRFDDIVQPLVRMVEETVSTPDATLRFEVEGDAGNLPGDVATAARGGAQRADAERGRPRVPARRCRSDQGSVLVRLARHGSELVVEVIDDGVGLPPGFTVESSKGLGLSIVQALVNGELGGSIELGPAARDTGGTHVRLRVPLAPSAPVEL